VLQQNLKKPECYAFSEGRRDQGHAVFPFISSVGGITSIPPHFNGNLLSAFAAELVQCSYTNFLNKRSARIWIKRLDAYILMCVLTGLFYIFVLPFLYFNFLPQRDCCIFKVLLLSLIEKLFHRNTFPIEEKLSLDSEPGRVTEHMALKTCLSK